MTHNSEGQRKPKQIGIEWNTLDSVPHTKGKIYTENEVLRGIFYLRGAK
jgi:hypothetical protein